MSDIVTPSKPTLTTDKPASTQYVILKLRENDETEVYELATQISASSAEEAVRKGSFEKPGTYVAVPARSWQPRRVKVETVPKITLEDA